MIRAILTIAFLFLIGNATYAADDELYNSLMPLRYKVSSMKEAATEGFITKDQADAAIASYVAKAHSFDSEINTADDLLLFKADAANDAAQQKTEGFFTSVRIFWVIGIILGVVGFCALTWSYLILMPFVVYESALYLGVIGLIVGAHFLSYSSYYALAGCLGLAGAISMSAKIRRLPENLPRFCAILMVVWGCTAVYYQSPMIGFITAMAFMGTLGFAAGMGYFCYWIGFDRDSDIPRATAAAFALLVVFGTLNSVGDQFIPLAVFKTGALWMGSFVGYLGLLILSHRWYARTAHINYFAMQAATIIAGVGSIALGSTFNIPQLQQIGGTFFCLYLLEKITDIPANSIRQWSAISLVTGIGIFYLAKEAHNHQEIIHQYFLFQ